MLCASFQCDHCWFVNLQNREPRLDVSVMDVLLMPYIRRASLDILWSQETSNLYSNYRSTVKKMELSRDFNLPLQFEPRGPCPVGDFQSFQTALEMLRQSDYKERMTRRNSSLTPFVNFDQLTPTSMNQD